MRDFINGGSRSLHATESLTGLGTVVNFATIIMILQATSDHFGALR